MGPLFLGLLKYFVLRRKNKDCVRLGKEFCQFQFTAAKLLGREMAHASDAGTDSAFWICWCSSGPARIWDITVPANCSFCFKVA